MDTPLVGTPKANYRFFYTVGGGVMFSLLLLLIITSYSASIIDVNYEDNSSKSVFSKMLCGLSSFFSFCSK